MNRTSLLTDTLTSLFPMGADPSWVQDDIFHVSMCDGQVNTAVKTPTTPPRRREISFSRSSVNSRCLFVWFFEHSH